VINAARAISVAMGFAQPDLETTEALSDEKAPPRQLNRLPFAGTLFAPASGCHFVEKLSETLPAVNGSPCFQETSGLHE